MKQIINTLAIVFLTASLVFSQTKTSPKPVKKVVTSKITKDPKTGKVVKTITTVTTTDIVLDPGRQSTISKPAAKPVAKQKVVAKAAKKPVPAKKPAPVVAKKTSPQPNLEAPKAAVVETKTEDNSIFANPADNSAKNVEKPAPVAEKPVVTSTTKSSPIASNNNKTKKPTQVYKEKSKRSKDSDGKFNIGLRGGMNFADVANVLTLTPIPTPTDHGKTAFNGGVFANLALGNVLSIQPEINYSQQGYYVTNGIDTDRLNNHAVNVPVLLKLTVGGPNVKVFINGGPYAGFLMKSEKILDLYGQKVINLVDFATDGTKEISTNRLDYGMQTGAGLQFNLGGPKLELEARYNYGLADPMNYSGTKPSYIGETGRNRVFTGTIGLMFPIGK